MLLFFLLYKNVVTITFLNFLRKNKIPKSPRSPKFSHKKYVQKKFGQGRLENKKIQKFYKSFQNNKNINHLSYHKWYKEYFQNHPFYDCISLFNEI